MEKCTLVHTAYSMGNKLNSINLLKSEEKSLFERILAWTLTVGRVLVIFTEGVALVAFLYRFGLDMKLVDLKDEIRPLQAYVESKKEQEENFRDIQDRLALVKKHDPEAPKMNTLFQNAIKAAQGKVRFNTIDVSNETIKIDAVTRSPGLMSAYIASLKAFPEVKSISVDKVESTQSNAEINMLLSVNIKTVDAKKAASSKKK